MEDLSYLTLGGFVLAVMAAASSGALFKPDRWYRALKKPSWNPPDWVFGAGWSVLYLMIAVSGWLVWENASDSQLLIPMAAYAIQLILNAVWSGLFFGLKNPALALFELVLLWLAILANILLFHPVSSLAAWLLVPYLLWVTFAGALNTAVWRLNRVTA